MNRNASFLVCALLAAVAALPANAAVIATSSAVRVTDFSNVLLDQVVDQNSGSGVVSSSMDDLQGHSRATANDAAYIFTSAGLEAAGGDILTTSTARVDWKTSYVASSAGNYSWNFSIPTGMLSVAGNSSNGGWASYDIMISGGNASWHSSAKLIHDSRLGYSYSTSGQSLGGAVTGSGTLSDFFTITFDPYSDSLALGFFNIGDIIDITYTMIAEAGGPGYEIRAYSAIGDPAGLSGGEGGVLVGAPANSVPEPSSLFLALAGLGLMLFIAARLNPVRTEPRSAG